MASRISNRLIQRVRRHQNIATIFRSPVIGDRSDGDATSSARGRLGGLPTLVIGQLPTAETFAVPLAKNPTPDSRPAVVQTMPQAQYIPDGPTSRTLQREQPLLSPTRVEPDDPDRQQEHQLVQPDLIDGHSVAPQSASTISQADTFTSVDSELSLSESETPPVNPSPMSAVQAASQTAQPTDSAQIGSEGTGILDLEQEQSTSASEDDRLWTRLQQIRQAHEGSTRQEQESTGSIQRTATTSPSSSTKTYSDPASDIGHQTAEDSESLATDLPLAEPKTSIETEHLTNEQDSIRPSLDQVWPVQRRSTEDRPTRDVFDSAKSDQHHHETIKHAGTDESSQEISESVQTVLQTVAPSRNTESAIHIVAPRKPRPTHLQARRASPNITDNPSRKQQGEPEEPTGVSISDVPSAVDNLASVQMQQKAVDAQPAREILDIGDQTIIDESPNTSKSSNISQTVKVPQEPNTLISGPAQQAYPQLPAVQRSIEESAIRPTDYSSTVQTEIGELPSDLWTLIDEPVPERSQPESPSNELSDRLRTSPDSIESNDGKSSVAEQSSSSTQVQPESGEPTQIQSANTIQRSSEQSASPTQVSADEFQQVGELLESDESSVNDERITAASNFDDMSNIVNSSSDSAQPPLPTPLGNEPAGSEAPLVQRTEAFTSEGQESSSGKRETAPGPDPNLGNPLMSVHQPLDESSHGEVTKLPDDNLDVDHNLTADVMPARTTEAPNSTVSLETESQNQMNAETHPNLQEHGYALSSVEKVPAENIIQEALAEADTASPRVHSEMRVLGQTAHDDGNENDGYGGADHSLPHTSDVNDSIVATTLPHNDVTLASNQRSIQNQSSQGLLANMRANEARNNTASSASNANDRAHKHAPTHSEPLEVSAAVMRATLEDEEMALGIPAADLDDGVAEPSTSDDPAEGEDAESTAQEEDDDEISELARQVYAFLQRKLAVERERMH